MIRQITKGGGNFAVFKHYHELSLVYSFPSRESFHNKLPVCVYTLCLRSNHIKVTTKFGYSLQIQRPQTHSFTQPPAPASSHASNVQSPQLDAHQPCRGKVHRANPPPTAQTRHSQTPSPPQPAPPAANTIPRGSVRTGPRMIDSNRLEIVIFTAISDFWISRVVV